MSTTLFAKSTSARLGQTGSAKNDLATSFVNAAAGLVPAEALVVQAAILQIVTKTTTATKGHPATTMIVHPDALRVSFWGLLLLSAVAYLAGRWTSDQKFRGLDIAGVLIAPAAYVGWSLLQTPSAFDAAFSATTQTGRETVGYLLVGLLVVLAPVFGYSVAKATPKTK